MKKIGLIFGGPSNEHEVSLMSARNVVKYFDYEHFELVLIYWGKNGVFYCVPEVDATSVVKEGDQIHLENFNSAFDIALLMTHGRFGEDGVLQGLFGSQNIPYCGSGVLGSAVCMDKALFKELMLGAGIRQTKFLYAEFVEEREEKIREFMNQVELSLKFPLFVKPANSGSSVGISKVKQFDDLEHAILLALKHDTKVIVEEGLEGVREIEVAVLGNDKLLISSAGELMPGEEFYDYDDKYKLGKSIVTIPAKLHPAQEQAIRTLAEKSYRLAGCRGFARVDFFIYKEEVFLNEINTLPGFTDISMFPMLMKNCGLSYTELLNKIISFSRC